MSTKSEVFKKVEELARIAYKPITKQEDEAKSLLDSKFGGQPFINEPNYPWPICACGKKMQFFLQLNSATLPSEVKENYFDGLMQFFYCIEKCDEDGWKPFSKSNVVRVCKSVDLKSCTFSNVLTPKSGLFPEKKIVSWEEKKDYITITELLKLDYSFAGDYDLIDSIQDNFENQSGEKLFGWPCWVQGVEYPTCRKCNK